MFQIIFNSTIPISCNKPNRFGMWGVPQPYNISTQYSSELPQPHNVSMKYSSELPQPYNVSMKYYFELPQPYIASMKYYSDFCRNDISSMKTSLTFVEMLLDALFFIPDYRYRITSVGNFASK